MVAISRPLDLTAGLTCKLDAWNRLVEVKDGQTVVSSHEHDGLNRRTIEAPVYGATTYYLHKFWNSSWQMVEMRSTTTQNAQPESCSVSFQYVWSARYIDAAILREYSGSRYYFLGDANFNVTTLVDTAGDAVERYLYDPYGKVTIYTGDWSSTRASSSYDNHQLYTGRWQDYKTQLYNYRERYYSAELGRFLSRDPVGYAARRNLYGYVGGRPVVVADPMGLTDIKFGGGFWKCAGGSVDVTVKVNQESCCLPGGVPSTRTAYGVEGHHQVGLGYGIEATVAGVKIEAYFKFPILNIQWANVCRSPCGRPNAPVCCKACGSIGFNPAVPSIGFGVLVAFDLDVDVQGQLKWCYNWGACPANGFAIGFCGKTKVTVSGSLLWWNKTETLYEDFSCIMMYGTQGMLDER